jgi:hypothetical protein
MFRYFVAACISIYDRWCPHMRHPLSDRNALNSKERNSDQIGIWPWSAFPCKGRLYLFSYIVLTSHWYKKLPVHCLSQYYYTVTASAGREQCGTYFALYYPTHDTFELFTPKNFHAFDNLYNCARAWMYVRAPFCVTKKNKCSAPRLRLIREH